MDGWSPECVFAQKSESTVDYMVNIPPNHESTCPTFVTAGEKD